MTNKKSAHNSTYMQVATQWLNQALCFYESLCLVDSKSLRNRHLRVAAARYAAAYDDTETYHLIHPDYLDSKKIVKPKIY